MSKYKFTAEEKLLMLERISNREVSLEVILKSFGINNSTYHRWKIKYEKFGLEGLSPSQKSRSYSVEFKLNAVQSYLRGEGSLNEISQKFGLYNTGQLSAWIKKYNSHDKIKSYKVGERIMTKGRTTTLQERVEIAGYCIANRYEYQNTADKYNVSYQQVYQWVKKFEAGGEDLLVDKRGRAKQVEILSDLDKLELEMKRLKVANERLKAENHVLKKLQMLERGLM